jgi:hypothetical protein
MSAVDLHDNARQIISMRLRPVGADDSGYFLNFNRNKGWNRFIIHVY